MQASTSAQRRTRKSETPAIEARAREDQRARHDGPRDPISAYLAQVASSPRLPSDEEMRLAREYAADRNPVLKSKLAKSQLGLVVQIVRSYPATRARFMDAIQEGNVGLLIAIDRFDPARGVPLGAYATFWIRAYVLAFIVRDHRLVRVGSTRRERHLFFNLGKERAKLVSKGIEVTREKLATRLGVDQEDVAAMEAHLATEESLHSSPRGESRPIEDQLASPDAPTDEVICEGQLTARRLARVAEFGSALDRREELIFRERLVAEDPVPLRALGVRLGVSGERVRQLETRLRARLSEHLTLLDEHAALDAPAALSA